MEPVDVDAGEEIGRQQLHHDLPSERRLFGEEDAGHAAAAELTLERVRAAESRLEVVAEVGHGVWAWGRNGGANVPFGPATVNEPCVSSEDADCSTTATRLESACVQSFRRD